MEIIRAMRGALSQTELSTRLKFKHNRVSKWECGYPLKWDDFTRICTATGYPLAEALKVTYNFAGNPEDTSRLVLHFKRDNSIKTIADATESSVSTVKRWLSGELTPAFPKMMALMSYNSALLPQFIATLIPPERLPQLGKTIEEHFRKCELVLEAPESMAVLAALHLSLYKNAPKHDPRIIAAKLGMDCRRVDYIIGICESIKLVSWSGTHYRQISEINLSFDKTKFRSTKKYHIDYTISRVLSYTGSIGSREEPYVYLVAPTTKETRKRICRGMGKFYKEIEAEYFNNQDSDFDEVSIVSFSMVQSDGLGKDGELSALDRLRGDE